MRGIIPMNHPDLCPDDAGYHQPTAMVTWDRDPPPLTILGPRGQILRRISTSTIGFRGTNGPRG
jgi:hypothetical protein